MDGASWGVIFDSIRKSTVKFSKCGFKRGNGHKVVEGVNWCSFEATTHLSDGIILGYLENGNEPFDVSVRSIDRKAIGEDRKDNGVKDVVPIGVPQTELPRDAKGLDCGL